MFYFHLLFRFLLSKLLSESGSKNLSGKNDFEKSTPLAKLPPNSESSENLSWFLRSIKKIIKNLIRSDFIVK
jgi:hypothetical protein